MLIFCFLHYLQGYCGNYGASGKGMPAGVPEFDHLQIPRYGITGCGVFKKGIQN